LSLAEAGGTAYAVNGDGPDIVLIHGLGLNLNMWQWQLDALAAHYRVIRYDLLGHGNSQRLARDYLMDDMVGQLAGLVDALAVEKFALFGFSLGGLIAQAFVLEHPDQVAALGVLNTAHNRSDEQRDAIMLRVRQSAELGPGATVDDAMDRWFSEAFAASRPDVLQRVRGWVLANDRDEYPRLYRLLANGDRGLESAISGISCPALVMTGEQDFGNSPDMAARMATLMPRGKALILPGLRHMALAEKPDVVNAALLQFLEGAMPGGVS